MLKPLYTLLYVSKKLDIEELHMLRNWLLQKYGKVFLMVPEKEPKLVVYEEVLNNIDVYMPQTGEKVAKLVEVATSKSVPYTPIGSSLNELNAFKHAKDLWNDANTGKQSGQGGQNVPIVYPMKQNPMPMQQMNMQPMNMQPMNMQPMNMQPNVNPMPQVYNPTITQPNQNAYPTISNFQVPTIPQNMGNPQPNVQNMNYAPQNLSNQPQPKSEFSQPSTTPNVQQQPKPYIPSQSPQQPPQSFGNQPPTQPPNANPNFAPDDMLADLERQINDLKKD